VKILSIQSAVAYGHVGNSAAVFPLQRIGVEVLPVNTVNFSNHTGYGAWRGSLIEPDDVHDVILGIEERGMLPQIDVVLSDTKAAPESATSS
jgi:pyridoxine kinase